MAAVILVGARLTHHGEVGDNGDDHHHYEDDHYVNDTDQIKD